MAGELISALCGLFFLIVLVTVVGHGLWIMFASLFKGARDEPSPPPLRPRKKLNYAPATVDCLRCGEKLPPHVTDCPRCGLDCEGLAAEELNDLEATARQLERFRRNQLVPPHILDELWNMIQARHKRLVGMPEMEVPTTPVAPAPLPQKKPEPKPVPQPVPVSQAAHPAPKEKPPDWVVTEGIEPVRNGLELETPEEIPSVIPVYQVPEEPVEVVPEPPPWRKLQLLLDNRSDAELTASDRVRVVLLYRQSSEDRLAALPATVQFRLARLLHAARLDADAWRTYRRCLDRFPQHPDYVEYALAAIALGVKQNPTEAEQLLQQVKTRSLSAHQDAEAKRLAGLLPIIPAYETEVAKPVTQESRVKSVAMTAAPQWAPEMVSATPEKKSSKWSELLAGFMEEKNILWGELIGGLLIVGGSIALVISLWDRLKENQYFPFGIFAAVILGLFGAALYTWNHWKLQSTSRGLMAIATLLVPLSFLVLPRMLNEQANETMELAIAGAALVMFFWCIGKSAPVLAPGGRWLLPIAVLGPCVAQIVGVRVIGETQPPISRLLLLGAIPVACHGVSQIWMVRRLRGETAAVPQSAFALLATLALATFSLSIALGFLVVRCPEPLLALQFLTPLLAVTGISVLSGGLVIQKRFAENREQGILRTIGTAILLTGIGVMLLALLLAWPMPVVMLTVCAINFLTLGWLAFRHDLPLAHLPSLLSLAVGYLVSFHLKETYSPELADLLIQHLWSMTGAIKLVCLGLAIAFASELLQRCRQNLHGLYYLFGAEVVVALSVVMATWHGITLPREAALVYVLASLGCLATNLRWARSPLSYAGLILLVGATLWALRGWYSGEQALWSLALAGEAMILCLVGGLLVRKKTMSESGTERAWRNPVMSVGFGKPFLRCAEGIAVLAIGFFLWSGWWYPWQLEHVIAGGLLTCLYLLLTRLEKRQLTATLSGVLLVATVVAEADWLGGGLGVADIQGAIALAIASTCCLMALVTLLICLRLGKSALAANAMTEPDRPWYCLLPLAWREVVLLAGFLSVWLIGTGNTLLESRLHTFTLGVASATAWLLVWQHRSRLLSWAGSLLFLIALAHGLRWALDLETIRLAMSALLAHASIQILIGLLLRRNQASNKEVQRLLINPLVISGMFSSFLVIPLLLIDREAVLSRTGFACWLAAIWLVVSWSYRLPHLYTGFQLVSILTVVFAVTSWLEGQGWVIDNWEADLLDPRSLQAYGVGLALLCWAWVLARIALQRNRVAKELLLPSSQAVDWLLLGFLLLAQLGLADWAILREVVWELTPGGMELQLDYWPEVALQVYGRGAWILLGLLALVLLTSLWQPAPDRRQKQAILGFPILALTIPALLAFYFIDEYASASALRFLMAAVFGLASVPLWLRRPIANAAYKIGIPKNEDRNIPRSTRIILLDGLALPLLVLTIITAVIHFQGLEPSGPLSFSLFQSLGVSLSLALPLVILCGFFVGHALREQSPGYAFSAGQLLLLAIGGGFALTLVPAFPVFGDAQWVELLQVATLCTAGWAIVWLASRPYVATWRENGQSRLAGPLMEIQIALPVVATTCLLLFGISYLFTLPDVGLLLPIETWYPPPGDWTIAAGAPLGWAALAATVLAVYLEAGRRYTPTGVGVLCLALAALITCSVVVHNPLWGLRTFLVGLTASAIGWVLLPLWLLENSSSEKRAAVEPFFKAAPLWVYGTGILLVLLGLQAGLIHQDRLFASGIIGLTGVAVALAGIQRKHEPALFLGGLTLNIATSLAVWHFHLGVSFTEWWMLLLQANGITLLLVSLGWVHLHKSMYPKAGQYVKPTELLAWQFPLGILALTLPILVTLGWLCVVPSEPPLRLTAPLAGWVGWVQLVLALIVLYQCGSQIAPRRLVHFTGLAGILLVGQVVSVISLADNGNWLAYHTLALGFAVIGGLVLMGGWVATSFGELGPRQWSEEKREKVSGRLLNLFPALATQRWVECLGILLVGLALRSSLEDPVRPYWGGLAVLLSSSLAAGLFFWTSRIGYLHIGGSLLGLVAVVLWLAWGAGQVDNLLYGNTLALAIASVVTAQVERWWNRTSGAPSTRMWLADHTGLYSLHMLTGFLVLLVLIVTRGTQGYGFPTSELVLSLVAIMSLPISLLAIIALISSSGSAHVVQLQEPYPWQVTSFSHRSCFLALNILAMMLLIGVASDLTLMGLRVAGPLAWSAWAMLALASLVRTGDGISRQSGIACLPVYGVGLLGLALVLHQLHLEPEMLCWLAAPMLGCFVLLGCLVCYLVPDQSWFRRYFLKKEGGHFPEQSWFLPMQTLLGFVVLGLSFWIVCSQEELLRRLVGAGSVGVVWFASMILNMVYGVRASGESARNLVARYLRYGTLVLGSLFALALAWAIPDLQIDNLLLVRNVLLMAVLGLATLAYGVALPRRLPPTGSWGACCLDLARVYWLLGLAAVLAVLTHEFFLFQPHQPEQLIPAWTILVAAVTIIAFVVASVWLALVPEKNSFALSENWRIKYVYAAEVLVFLLFFHLRVTAPHLFGGPLRRWAPVIMMGLGFVGVGLSELFNRRKIRVLAIPLQRTGLFLPLIPLVTFWLSASGDLWQLLLGARQGLTLPALPAALEFDRYSLYWFLAGGVYLLAAIVRRSSTLALLASLAANFGFWALLFHHREQGVGFLTHPQLWLIPLAVILLAAEHINRDRLSPAQSAAVRYLGLIVLYLSSTADLFISGLQDIGMSLVLLMLSVAGIFAGIMLRVRAFLFVGFTFLLLVIFARIWHAAVDLQQTWVWWASLIVLGIAILTLFAVFEKRRSDLLHMLDEFKNWK